MRPILLVQAALAIDSTDRFVFFSQHLFERFGRPWLPVYTCFNPLSATRASLGPVDERRAHARPTSPLQDRCWIRASRHSRSTQPRTLNFSFTRLAVVSGIKTMSLALHTPAMPTRPHTTNGRDPDPIDDPDGIEGGYRSAK